MKQTLRQFIIANFTLSVFISIIVFKIFALFLDEFLAPGISIILDPNGKLPTMKKKVGVHTIEHGKALRDFIILVMILFITYFLFRTK